mgnify:CR=1 FL=1
MYNKVILIGNLTRDVELKNTTSGKVVANIGLASNQKWGPEENQKSVYYANVEIWGSQAEACAKYLKKGSKALVEGSLETRTWHNESGERKSRDILKASKVHFLDSKPRGDGQKNNEGDLEPF